MWKERCYLMLKSSWWKSLDLSFVNELLRFECGWRNVKFKSGLLWVTSLTPRQKEKQVLGLNRCTRNGAVVVFSTRQSCWTMQLQTTKFVRTTTMETRCKHC